MEVYILGTKYTIVDIPDNDEYDGICDTSIKQIKIAEFKDDGSWRSKGNLDYARKKTLRHEIVHAFLYESGMDTDSLQDGYFVGVGDEGTLAEQLDGLIELGRGERVRRQVFRCGLPDVGDSGGVQRTAKHRGGEWRHRGGLDLSVKLLVVGQEPLVVATVARLRSAVDGDHQAGADIGAAADATGYLDVLSGGLGLSNDGHQAEAVDVDTDLDDV